MSIALIPFSARGRIESQLSRSQSLLHRNAVAIAFRDGVCLSMQLIVILAVPAGLLIYTSRARFDSGSVIWGAATALLLIGIIIPLATVARVLLVKPEMDFTAERLDAALRSKNRIAIGLELSQTCDIRTDIAQAFAGAAVEQAITLLGSVHDCNPLVVPVRWPVIPLVIRFSMIVGILILALKLPTYSISHSNLTAATLDKDLVKPLVSSIVSHSTLTEFAKPNLSAAPQMPAGESSQEFGLSRNSNADVNAGSVGDVSESETSRLGSALPQSSANTTRVASSQKALAPSLAHEPSEPGSSKPSKSGGASGSAGGSALSMAGAAGSNNQQAEESLGKQQGRDQSSSTDPTDVNAEMDTDVSAKDAASNTVRPFLQDRAQAPSRELSPSASNTGGGGTGRSGPSATKKSRGVASFLIGVPIPSFIQGRLLQGPSRSSEKLIPPQVQSGNPAPAAMTVGSSDNEPVIERFDAPGDARSVIEHYFMSIHHDAEVSTADLAN